MAKSTQALAVAASAASIVVIAVAAAALAPSASDVHRAGVPGSSSTAQSESASPAPGVVIDWDKPVVNGIATTQEDAGRAGALDFTPNAPSIDGQTPTVWVSDPATTPTEHRSVSMLYRFPTSAMLPTDGRVLVIETPSQVPSSALREIATQQAASAGSDHFQYVEVDGIPGIMIQANGIARLHMVNGAIATDITGPATSVDAVNYVARALDRA